nr:peptidyl-tRNA hydrolase, mitochondrial [Tanacetum cinerariifolium]
MLRKLFSTNRGFCTSIHSPKPWLFVGLGNPGDKFKGTRHNVGFNMIDTFAETEGIAMDMVFCKAIFGKGLYCRRCSCFTSKASDIYEFKW